MLSLRRLVLPANAVFTLKRLSANRFARIYITMENGKFCYIEITICAKFKFDTNSIEFPVRNISIFSHKLFTCILLFPLYKGWWNNLRPGPNQVSRVLNYAYIIRMHLPLPPPYLPRPALLSPAFPLGATRLARAKFSSFPLSPDFLQVFSPSLLPRPLISPSPHPLTHFRPRLHAATAGLWIGKASISKHPYLTTGHYYKYLHKHERIFIGNPGLLNILSLLSMSTTLFYL